MQEFTIEIAGVPARIRCRYAESRRFFGDYISDKPPLFTVEPDAADSERMRTASGGASAAASGFLAEIGAVHRLLAERMTEYGVLLMHGSALCMDGEAYIFIAPSGTGKSTHARLWRETFGDRVWMINDDKPMLRIGDNGVTVFGTPWDGKHRLSRNACAPLKAVVWLTRDRTNHIEPLSRAEAFPLLLRQCYTSKRPETMARILAMEKTLLDSSAFYSLGCTTDPEAAVTAWQGMQRG